MESHLLQMRGLKRQVNAWFRNSHVASFTDAWIETGPRRLPYRTARVASFTDAWIETLERLARSLLAYVASFTDAWIETEQRE